MTREMAAWIALTIVGLIAAVASEVAARLFYFDKGHLSHVLLRVGLVIAVIAVGVAVLVRWGVVRSWTQL